MKVLKGQLAIFVVLTMIVSMLCCNVNAAGISSVTSGSGAALINGGQISASETGLVISFDEALDETAQAALETDVVLATDVELQNVLHIANPGRSWDADNLRYTFDGVPTGIYNLSYTFKVDAPTAGHAFGFTVRGASNNNNEWMRLGRNATFGTFGIGESNTTSGVSYEPGKWYTINAVLNFTDGVATATSTDENNKTTNLTSGFTMKSISNETGGYIGLGVAPAHSTGVGEYVELKTVSITHQATSAEAPTTKVDLDFSSDTLGEGLNCTIGASSDTVVSYQSIATSMNEIICDRTYNDADYTYTITPDGGFVAGEAYTLLVGNDAYNFTVSDPYNAVITTGNGEAVTDGGKIDLSETSLNLSYDTTMDESDLDEKVKLATDVQTGNILHIVNPGRSWDADNLRYTFDGVPTGIYNLSYTFKVDASTASHAFGFTVRGASNNNNEWMRFGRNAQFGTFGIGESSTRTNVAYEPGKWYTINAVLNFIDGEVDITSTDENNETSVLTSGFAMKAISNETGGYIGLGVAPAHSTGAGEYVELKDVRITHKATADAASTTEVDLDFLTDTLGDGMTCTVGSSSDTVVTYPEVLIMNEISCAREFDAENNVYTLTPDNGFEIGKTYTVVSGDNMTDFTVENINGNFIVDSVSKGSAAIENGDYVALGGNSIDIKFSGDVSKEILDENVTLTKYAMKKMYHVEEPVRAFNKNGGLRYHFAETSGIYSIEHTFRTESVKDYYGFSLRDRANNPDTGTGDGAEIGRLSFASALNLTATEGTRGESGGIAGAFTREADKWTKMRIDVDLDNRAFRVVVNDEEYFPSTTEWYVCKTTDFGLGYVCIGVMGDSQNATDICDLSVSYKASENASATTLFKTDFSNITAAQLAEVFKFGGADNPTIGNCVDSESVVECISEYDDETGVYSLKPIVAPNYLDELEVNIPEMVSADGKQLMNPQSIRFTAVYLDSFLTSSAGFKAGDDVLTSISNSFTGTITGWAKVSNYSDAPASAKVIVALYNDGRLVDVNMGNITMDIGATDRMGSADVTVKTADEGYTAVVYIWDDIDTMHAISPQSGI